MKWYLTNSHTKRNQSFGRTMQSDCWSPESIRSPALNDVIRELTYPVLGHPGVQSHPLLWGSRKGALGGASHYLQQGWECAFSTFCFSEAWIFYILEIIYSLGVTILTYPIQSTDPSLWLIWNQIVWKDLLLNSRSFSPLSLVLGVLALLPEISEVVISLSPSSSPSSPPFCPCPARRRFSMGSCSHSGGQHSVARQLPEKKHMLLRRRQSVPVCFSDAVA